MFKKLKNWSLTLASLTLLFVSATSNSFAQSSSFDDFQRKVNEGVAEIAKYQQVLQNPDVRVQYQAVQYMLKSNDPALQRIAKEHALFSTNPVMRGSAIKAILDSGQNLRLVVTSTGEKSADVFRWLAWA
ncbi:MAG: HEAT repeat domain-containing protein [Pseudomonadota bacterium]